MHHPVRPLVLWLVLAGALPALVACQSGSRRGRAAGAPGDANGADPGAGEGTAAGEVNLTPADLAPIDAYIKRPQWILGDDVDVVASKEYFVQVLSISTRIGLSKREDFQDRTRRGSVITFLGRPEQVSEQTAPRVLIGTGLTDHGPARAHRAVRAHARRRPPGPPPRGGQREGEHGVEGERHEARAEPRHRACSCAASPAAATSTRSSSATRAPAPP